MTRDEILAMPAGREMDALIAEKVMELKVTKHERRMMRTVFRGMRSREVLGTVIELLAGNKLLQEYSIDMSAAWQVVKEMSAKNYWFGCQVLSSTCEAWFSLDRVIFKAKASTYDLPLAICHAALLATLEE